MKSAVETLDPTKVKLTVTVDTDEMKPHIDKAYKTIANQVTIPGFRKGKVPARIIDQRFGWGAVAETAINDSLNDFYGKALTEEKIRPMAQPNVEVTEVPESATSGNLVFVTEIEVRPTVEFPELDTLKLTVEPSEVTDADVDERLDLLRERFGSLVGVDRPAQDGDYVTIDLKAMIGDDEVDSVSGVNYQIGSGNMLEGLDEALVGLSADETTTFNAPLAGGERAGEDAVVTVTATGVKEKDLPELDDDFAEMASEFETLDELREDVTKQVTQVKVGEQAAAARDALVDVLLEATDIPVPAGVLQSEVDRVLEQDTDPDDARKAEVTEEITKAIRLQILQDSLAEKLDIQVSQAELVDFLIGASQQYQMEPQEFMNVMGQSGQMPAMMGELSRQKGLTMALRRVDVKDTTGAEVDLKPFIGSDEDDAAQAAIQEAMEKAAAESADDDAADVPEVTGGDHATAIPEL
ncbi:MAG: trigger factor [Cellulomonadaceae bacterium]|jgi:trigger factor|nr:trigger factor [Cellulomonadaceae bacterium]